MNKKDLAITDGNLETFFITCDEEGERLDKILSNRFKEVGSRSYFQYLIDEGKVLLNGQPVKKRIKPNDGDEVEIEYILSPELKVSAENIPLNIIYEDEHLLVVNKAAGMVVHPACGNWSGTFVNALLFYLQNSNSDFCDSIRPGIVHRLDKDTSGLILAAKNLQVQNKLINLFIERKVHKEYLAICVGNSGYGTIHAPLGRHPVHRKKMAVLETGGREAITHHKTLSSDAKLCLVNLVIATGRTHQIRVHMRHHGTPVLGDEIYGVPTANAKYGAIRQMLHAHKLKFIHPITEKECQFEAEVPEDMAHFIRHMRG